MNIYNFYVMEKIKPLKIKIIRFFTNIKLSDKILLIIFVFASLLLAMIRVLIGGSLQQLLIISYVVYSLAFAATYLLSSRFSRRITALAFKIQEIAAGNFSGQLDVSSRDEIGQLTNALNELLNRLRTGVAIDVSKNIEIDHAKSDFVALASHQLRTPLAIIKWLINYLQSGDAGALNEEQRKYIDQAYLSNERLIELVNALLDVSRIDVGTFSIEPEPTDLIKIAEEAIRDYQEEIREKKIDLERNFVKLPRINLDQRLTKKVFTSLLSNSIKYTSAGGKVRFEIKQAGDNAYIKIADTGIGIPRSEQPKIFTKMFRADNVRQIESIGTGLGLYIAKAVIEQSGGKIWFESPSMGLLMETEAESGKPIDQEHKGTTFYITIPLKGMKKKKGTKKLTDYK